MNISRLGMIGVLGALLAVLWLLAVYSVYEDNRTGKYNVTIKPGAVTYGAPSTAVIPMGTTTHLRSAVPMISGEAVRSYAHHGHASMPAASTASSFRLHTTSSATVHTIGAGGGGGGISSGGTSSHSRGTTNSGVSVSMPGLAMVTPLRATTYISSESSYLSGQSVEADAAYHGFGSPRRTPGITGDEEEGDEAEDDGKYWYWDGEQWVENGDIPIGTTKIEGGITYRWNGSSWEIVSDQQDPGLPLGDAPWLFLVILAAAYLMRKRKILGVGKF